MAERTGSIRRRASSEREWLGSESPLSATWRPAVSERAVLVAVAPGADDRALDELDSLARAAGATPVARLTQSRLPDPATYVGRGKLAQLHDAVHAHAADLVALDDELTPGQLRALEQRLRVKVLDRTALILDIFALHARSGEGKAQVELAQLAYLIPRLRGWGEAMSRLGGGIGTRGPGETKMEVDRQHIRRRMAKLRRDIVQLGKTRGTKRAVRERSGVQQVAIAGYTNAGKSTLMNALTDADVLVADQPFATLDPTTRRLALGDGRSATLSDTVGFVRKLPHELVEAFKSTLEEVARADLVVHVADASAEDLDAQLDAVRAVLAEIGAGAIPEQLVLNKWDLLNDAARARLARAHPEGVSVSALDRTGVEDLRARIADRLPVPPIDVELLVPFDRANVIAALHRRSQVLKVDDTEAGTRVWARVEPSQLGVVREFLVRPAAHRVRA